MVFISISAGSFYDNFTELMVEDRNPSDGENDSLGNLKTWIEISLNEFSTSDDMMCKKRDYGFTTMLLHANGRKEILGNFGTLPALPSSP